MEKEVGVPVSWNQLGDSTWFQVETSNKYTYYYNKETKETSWDKPALEKPAKEEVKGVEMDEVGKEDSDNYKELIRSLNLSNTSTYEQTIPRLLFDPRYKKIPQSHRKRLFNQLRRELMEEKASSTHTLPSLEELKKEDPGPEKRKLPEPSRRPEKHRRRAETHQQSHRDTHLRQMAENNFLSLLHEKVKMPFLKGEVAPLPAELLESDPRFHSEHLESKNYLYKKFVKDFLAGRLQLLESKLKNLDSVGLSLDEVVETLGPKLFGDLPRDELRVILKQCKEEKKKELVESFRTMLRQSLYYKEGKRGDNLRLAKLKFAKDERFTRLESFPEERDKLIMERLEELEQIHQESLGIAGEEE